jgi:hypothetical protein
MCVNLLSIDGERGRSVGAAATEIALKEFIAIGWQTDLAAGAVATRISAEDDSIAHFHFDDACTYFLDNPRTFVA